ncbi:MAG: glycosyl transferase, partial [Rhizobiaceae bacterium]
MHLVFATSLVPAGRPSTGYEIANAAVLDSLRRIGVRVTVLGFVWPGLSPDHPDTTIVLGEQDVRNETASRWQKGEWLATALAGGFTFASAKMRTISPRDVRAAIDRLGPVDGYILNSVQFAGAFPDIFRDRPSIYIAHNVEHRSASENAAAARGAVERLLFQREARLLARVEARLCADAAFVFT